MIVFNLACDAGHRFEGWFGSSADYDSQSERRLVVCPQCGSDIVSKAPMAPAIPVKGNARAPSQAPGTDTAPPPMANLAMAPELADALKTLAKAQAKALENSTWVGDKFADKARSMHYGEADEAPIHGQATRDEAKELIAEGIMVAPILFPAIPPDELN